MIRSVLTDYRDAIQFVHDQTVRNMNLGLSSDELVARVELPQHLANKQYLQEYYGRLGPMVMKRRGTIDHFTGDGMLVFFNDPVECDRPALRATESSPGE